MFLDFIICVMVFLMVRIIHSWLWVEHRTRQFLCDPEKIQIWIRPGSELPTGNRPDPPLSKKPSISVLIFLNSVGLFTQVCVKKIHVGPLRGLKPTISGSNGCAWADSKSDVTIVSACLNSTNKNVLTRILFYSFENITFFSDLLTVTGHD